MFQVFDCYTCYYIVIVIIIHYLLLLLFHRPTPLVNENGTLTLWYQLLLNQPLSR